MTNSIFDSKYVDEKPTQGEKPGSELKKFLKSPIDQDKIKNYGTSKPRRIVMKGKISGS